MNLAYILFIANVNFFILIFYRSRDFKIAYNGKSIGEVRAFEELKVQVQTNRSQYFFNGTKLIKNVELENIGG
ncbi:MAG: hypothetical protein JST62_09620 [Bacteroidetes bacterium]|nr:hypothetical protein [Bacteroidota bacterium]